MSAAGQILAADLLRRRSDNVDQVVTHAYRGGLTSAFPKGMALLAVGGYGRRELFPHSDIDLLLLVAKQPSGDDQRQALSLFLRTLWDNGLRLSQTVRTVPECCRYDGNNLEMTISLLDERFLIGDSGLYDELRLRLKKYVRTSRETLIKHLCKLTRERHTKFHETIYHLEPNVKESPGGIRDLHVIRWLGLLWQAQQDTPEALPEARDFLFDVRYKLHARSGRDQNVLTFDAQEEYAPDPAAYMRDYFRHAREIQRATLRNVETAEQLTDSGLLRSFQDWRSRLSNPDFTVSRDRVFLRSPQQLAADPPLVLRLFEFVARHGIRLSLETEKKIRDHALYLQEYFTGKPKLWPELKTILSQPHASLALRAMHDTGVMHIVLPAWEDIESLVVRDFYHRYTVDEHTLVTIEYLEELRATRDPARRRFSELLSETADLPLLYIALLFHDTGKSHGLAGHAKASAVMAHSILTRIGMPEQDRRIVLFLIEQHLALSAVLTGRDLNDPATARELAASVGTLENLKLLALMTYADISAVNPEAMTPWRLEQLWSAYLIGNRELTRELQSERIHLEGPDERATFLEGFPTRYLRTHTLAAIEAHMALSRRAETDRVALELERDGGVWRLSLVTSDRPGLFAAIAGALASFGMNIVRAEAFANGRGFVLDTFAFEDPMRTLELNPMEAERLESLLKRAALGEEDIPRLLQGRSKPVTATRRPKVDPLAAFDSSASETATLVEIVAQDRPGLLYDLASTFAGAGCSIDLVLIDTEAHKAIDVFYVTCDGRKLEENAQQSLRTKLLACLAA